ncbi:hypothetical protein [Sinorhizobium meliloti]|uniref:hypothetical protein n=1 Tax=Rhizobium meliloti TaxID=382 RepID=UPI000B49C3B8|nr:hypothetical protein [Sinorhizobium meliloti]ASP63357.1 hypothetical protein CDO29_01285 [Sinorhizobium meliloti]MQX04122.1 hypothetical protein [Sinorhizobium meliloti]RVK43883.1 hypothetical protein CN160_28195 [Sinorhizobium meliloti]RVQ31235.1 hypothetical protein CN068_29245 [Sinorhizobium meliloti]
MADRPILFSAPMVRALLAGRKTQTRRTLGQFDVFRLPDGSGAPVSCLHMEGEPLPRVTIGRVVTERKLKAAVGDRLWVKESWWIATMYSYGTTPGGCEISPPPLAHRKRDPVHYDADGNPPNVGNRTYGPEGLRGGSFAAPDPYAVWLKKPSIHMPRSASRLTLIVTDVRVEQLQDISEADAIAEGIERHHSGWMPYSTAFYEADGVTPANYHLDPRESYRSLWNRINGFGAWEANPWIACYSLRVIKQNIDQIEKVAA